MDESEHTMMTAVERERRFFDQYVRDAGEFNPFSASGWNRLRRAFEELVQPGQGGDYLDLGCGTGQSRQVYSRSFSTYTGVDLSPASIAVAQQQHVGDRFLVADACQLPFAENQFDVVAFSSVLHHIEEFSIALKEAQRVVKPGGKVFSFDPHAHHPAFALFRNPRSPLYLSQGVSSNERPLTAAELCTAYRQAGLIDVRQRCQSGISYRHVAPRVLNALLGMYNLADWTWQMLGLGNRFGSFVLTCGVKPM